MSGPGGKRRILIATTDPSLQGELALRLERAGHDARVCGTGRACLERMDEGGVDLLLLDLKLPGMSGLEVLAALRARRYTRECVLMAGKLDEALLARCVALKPVQVHASDHVLAHARAIVQEILERAATVAQAPPSDTTRRFLTRERRKHPRFEVDGAPARLRYRGLLQLVGLGRRIPCVVADLSEGGARVLSSRPIAPGDRVRLEVRFDPLQASLRANSEVRWCREPAAPDGAFQAGLSFVGLSPRSAREIGALKSWFDSPEARAERRSRRPPGP